MLEGIWYALLVAVQALAVNPANHDSKFIAEVYIDSKRTYTFELKGSMTDGIFYDRISKKNLGSFEESRKASRSYVISPEMAIEEKVDAKASDKAGASPTPSPVKAKESPKASEVPEIPPPFILDLSAVTKSMKDFGKEGFQSFKALVLEKKDKNAKTAETKKVEPDKKETPAEVSVLKSGDQYVYSDPQNGIIIIIRIEK